MNKRDLIPSSCEQYGTTGRKSEIFVTINFCYELVLIKSTNFLYLNAPVHVVFAYLIVRTREK